MNVAFAIAALVEPARASGWVTTGRCEEGFVLVGDLQVHDGTVYVVGELNGALTLPGPVRPVTVRARHEVAGNGLIVALDAETGALRWVRALLADTGVFAHSLQVDARGVRVFGEGGEGRVVVSDDPNAVEWQPGQPTEGSWVLRLDADGGNPRFAALPDGTARPLYAERVDGDGTALWGPRHPDARLTLLEKDGKERCHVPFTSREIRPTGLAASSGHVVVAGMSWALLRVGDHAVTPASSPTWFAAAFDPVSCAPLWLHVHDVKPYAVSTDLAIDGQRVQVAADRYDGPLRTPVIQSLALADGSAGPRRDVTVDAMTFVGGRPDLAVGTTAGRALLVRVPGDVLHAEEGMTNPHAIALGADLVWTTEMEAPGTCLRVERLTP